MDPNALPLSPIPELELVRVVEPSQVLEFSPRSFVTEASDLEWDPGFWPRVLCFQGEAFMAERADRSESGDLAGVLYLSPSGRSLTVVND